MTSNYQRLTYEQRCLISFPKGSDFSQRYIADVLEVNQSTISRELARNTGERGYRHKQAQYKAEQRRQGTIMPHKMTPAMIELVESKVRVEWSPEQVSGWLLEEQKRLISHETIYLHIWADKQAGGDCSTRSCE